MASEWPTVAGNLFAGAQTVVTTTELAVATLEIPTVAPGQTVELSGSLSLTTGTATTAVSTQIRRGSDITGTVVGTSGAVTIVNTAGGTNQYQCDTQDQPGDVEGQQYTLTVTQTGATGNGSAAHAHLTAIAHW